MKALESPIVRGMLFVLSVFLVLVVAIVSIAKSDPSNDTPKEIEAKVEETLTNWKFTQTQHTVNFADSGADLSVVGYIHVLDNGTVNYSGDFEFLNLEEFPGEWGKVTTPEVRLRSGASLVCAKDERLTHSMIVVFACRFPLE